MPAVEDASTADTGSKHDEGGQEEGGEEEGRPNGDSSDRKSGGKAEGGKAEGRRRGRSGSRFAMSASEPETEDEGGRVGSGRRRARMPVGGARGGADDQADQQSSVKFPYLRKQLDCDGLDLEDAR
eukprot:990475-Rhodomonas_salina.1